MIKFERWNASPPNIRNMTKVYAIITCILHFTGRFTLGNKVKKINKRYLDSKEVKLCEFRDIIIIYVKNLIESTKNIVRT